MAVKHQELPTNKWHVERGIPLALILGMVLQLGVFVWKVGEVSEKVATLEKRIEATGPWSERLVRLETQFESVKDGIKEIKLLVSRPMRLGASEVAPAVQ